MIKNGQTKFSTNKYFFEGIAAQITVEHIFKIGSTYILRFIAAKPRAVESVNHPYCEKKTLVAAGAKRPKPLIRWSVDGYYVVSAVVVDRV